ncbi:hypothetical protein EYF80_045430 [Liparis tanakae]|uniref:Uncharacterized protein n=1 Tax=Liparis tanakae TaxID=230148 RepID=A0A4Z2FUB5_9TELE|nr:hypothetical protein EYF80_045430 [Liparis tanakae]
MPLQDSYFSLLRAILDRKGAESAHSPARDRLRDEREGRTIFVVIATLLAIFTAVLYGDLTSSYKTIKTAQGELTLTEESCDHTAEQRCARTHWMNTESTERRKKKKKVTKVVGLPKKMSQFPLKCILLQPHRARPFTAVLNLALAFV